MWFVETTIFTRQLADLLRDDEYRQLQSAIILRPDQGKLIPGGGGLRKIRWGRVGRGKRGGCRVIYCWDVETQGIYLLLAYGKHEKDDLTRHELRTLRALVKEHLK